MSKGTIKYSQEFKSEFGNRWIGIDLVINENDDWDEKFSEAEGMVKKWGSGDGDFRRWSITENGATKVPTYQSPQPIPSLDYKAKERVEKLIDDAVSIEDLSYCKAYAAQYGLTTQYMSRLKQLSE